MNGLFKLLGAAMGKIADEYVKDYRDSSNRIYDLGTKTNTQINTIVLTVSVASLTAIAALNERVFGPYGLLSFLVVAVFIFVILLSVVNLYISMLSLADMRQKLDKNLSSFNSLGKGMENRKFKKTQKILNALVFVGFCFGLIALLVLLGMYILGTNL